MWNTWISTGYTCAPGGKFRTKSAYNFFSAQGGSVGFMIWDTLVLPRQSFCAWLATKGRPLTEDLLAIMAHRKPGICCSCSDAIESHDHQYFKCMIATNVQSAMKDWLEVIIPRPSLKQTLAWMKRTAQGRNIKTIVLRAGWCAVIYQVWRERSLRKFQNKCKSINVIVCSIQFTICTRVGKHLGEHHLSLFE